MNKNILKISTLVAFWAFCSQNATAQQGFGTNQPSKASVIEMKSGTKGLLIPRVALTGLNNFDPIKGELGTDAAKVNSLLVYNTATTTGITPGYYYWTTDGTTPNSYWKRLLAGDDAAALNLLGDVTGTLGATTVVKIQGRDVANTAPTSNQVLTWDGSAWTPTSLTPTQITDAQNVTAGSNKVNLGGTPTGASLQPFSIDVVEANLTLSNMGGKVTNDQITPGSTGQVLVTDGTTTTWIDQSVIAPTTTNALSSADNLMTSNVNEVSSSANIINSNTLVLTGNNLESTVNGVATTPAVDLSKYLDNTDNQTITDLSLNGTQLSITLERGNTIAVELAALTNTTNLRNGTNTTVFGDGSSTTPYTVNVATGNGTTLGVVKEAATNPSVAVAADGSLSVNIANITDRGSLSASTGDNSITVNNGTNATFVNTDIKVTDGGISTAKIADNAVTVQKLPAGATNTTFLRGDGAWVTPTDNNTTYSGSASVILEGTSFQRAALTGDVTAPQNSNVTTIANNAVTTPKIADDAVTAAKVNADVAGNGLTQAANGALQVNVNNGISIADDLVQLGGALIKPTTITATATNTLAVAGLQPTTDAAKTTDAFVVVGDNGVLKKADIKYSTTEQVTGKKWIGGQVVYERVLEVTLNVEANTITLPTGSRPAKIIGMRMISRTDNSITTELSRYNATAGVMVFGSGPTTQFQKVGTYDLILEYIK